MDEKDIVTVRIEDDDPLSKKKVRYATYSVVGNRENQQDSLFVGEKAGETFAVLCDGMGGLKGEEIENHHNAGMYGWSLRSRIIKVSKCPKCGSEKIRLK